MADRYCVTKALCGLCQFTLKNNELVYAALSDNRVSDEFDFQQQMCIYDEELDIIIHICIGDNALSHTKATVCFHSRCYEFRSYPVTPALLDATEYAFVAPAHEERRRADYIQRALAQNLQLATGWPRELPFELWRMIAEPLVQECAFLNTEELVHRVDAIGDSVLDLTQPVYATYVKVDGRYYVRSLLNAPGTDASKQAYLVLPARTEKQGPDGDDGSKDLFVAEDHVGVRRVIFVSPNRRDEWCKSHPSVPGAWWRHIPRETIPSAVAIKTNGLIVKKIQSTAERRIAGPSHIGWQVPVPFPPSVVDLLTLKTPRKHPTGLRMRFFDCNSPNITGYSVATDGANVLDIISHKQGQKPDRRLYKDVNSNVCFWMHMPINQGEYLTEICRRAGRLIIDTEVIGITLSTTRGRTVLFGLYGHENVNIQRITALPRESCRVYFNDPDGTPGKHRINFVAFDHGTSRLTIAKPGIPASPDVLPEVPQSISTPPYTQSNEIWLHSSCSMLGVVEVHPCVNNTSIYRPVMGMLLHYADGYRESIGQFRLDWAVEPIMVDKLDKLYFCGKQTEMSWGYVAHVTNEPPASRAQGSWLDVDQAGTLEWWFSSRHSVLFYNHIRLN